MKRFDYRVSLRERWFGAGRLMTLPPRRRAPFAAFVALVCLASVSGMLQDARFRRVQRDGDGIAARIAANADDLARVRTLTVEVERERADARQLAGVGRSGALLANTLASVGNRLPGDAWLTLLRIDKDIIAINGRSAGLAAVTTAMTRLAALSADREPRLVATHDDRAHAFVTYAITLRRSR